VSTPKKPQDVVTSEGDDQEKELCDQRFEHLMEQFYLSGDVEVLKDFIKRGGDIDQYDLREVIIELIDARAEPNPGGAKDAINIAFYMAVERRMMRWERNSKLSDEAVEDLTLQEQLLSLKKVGKTKAITEIAEEWSAKGRGVSYEGGRTRYETGKKLFIEKYDRVWN
jgi:hypothetical protein